MAFNRKKTPYSMLKNAFIKGMKSAVAALAFVFLSTSSFAQDAALISQGETIFKENCRSCHEVHAESVGPALAGIEKRRDKKWLLKWINNSQEVVASGDKYAVALYEKYGKAVMTSFPNITATDVDAIVAYVNSVPATAGPTKDTTQAGGGGANVPTSDGQYSTIVLVLIVIVLVLVLITLVIFMSVLRKFLADKEATLDESEKELVNQRFSIVDMVKSKMFITIVSIMFIGIAGRSCWFGLQTIGVEQNYMPVQPIPYSHKLHAGDLKIDCGYCHTGAYKGKQAAIPSLNICMNCHTHVKEGPKYGKEAIGRLVEAYEKGTPVRWVRVHNLPDLAYFNHSQHTVVAGIECQKCHGPIQEMEVVYQYSNLTMGWCINCHRETVVNAKDNTYYDRLLEFHNASKKKGDMKVVDIGGLECSKCHY